MNHRGGLVKAFSLGILGFLIATSLMVAEPVRIMVVGDSISVGYTDGPKWTVPFEFGFRSGLYKRLTNSGVAFQFVGGSREPWNGGSRGNYGVPTNQPSVDLRLLGLDHCEGYGGKKSAFILQNIASWVTNHSPAIVLLMIGINDIHASAAEPVGTERNLSNIVATVTAIAPKAHLIVAQGKHVTTVNQYFNMLIPGTTNIDGALFSNGINHPNAKVYDRMAETWFNGIMALNLHLPQVSVPKRGD